MNNHLRILHFYVALGSLSHVPVSNTSTGYCGHRGSDTGLPVWDACASSDLSINSHQDRGLGRLPEEGPSVSWDPEGVTGQSRVPAVRLSLSHQAAVGPDRRRRVLAAATAWV